MKHVNKGREESLFIVVPGLPVPQDRVRARAFINPHTGNPQASVYTRKGPTKDYRARIALAASEAIASGQRFESPISMILTFYVEKPKSKPKYKFWPDVKPDLDNYIKAVKDGLKGIAYRDDSQVCMLTAYKQYAIHSSPRTLITLAILDEERPHVPNEESTRQASTYVADPP